MKNPYPVAFVITVVLCALIIGYHVAFQGDDTDTGVRRPRASIAATDADQPISQPSSRLTAPPPPPTVTFEPPRGDAAATRPSLTTRFQPPDSQPSAMQQAGDGSARTGLTPAGPPADAAAPLVQTPPAAAASPTTIIPVTPTPASVPTPTAPAPSTPRTYTIKAGDSFASIALALYGSDSHWQLIGQANPLVDPAKLKPGQVINLPSPDAIGQQRETTAAPGEDRTPVYVVRAGDTLWNIAVQYYQNGRLWRHIYNANRGLIGPNPDKLEAGMRLRIPPAPEGAQ